MKKGIMFSNAYGRCVDEAMKNISNAGFDTLMTDTHPAEKMYELVNAASRAGLCFDQIHAPATNINSMWLDGGDGDATEYMLENSLNVASEFSVPYVVVHISSGDNAPHITDIGKRRFDRLVEHACKKGVTVAFENQRKLANLAFMMELYDDCSNVGLCWDSGHEACFAGGREYLPLFAKKLVCTHLHDNMKMPGEDCHLLPFDGQIDFEKAAKYIKNSGYRGVLNLEVNKARRDGFYDNLTIEEFLQKAYNALVRFDEMCKNA